MDERVGTRVPGELLFEEADGSVLPLAAHLEGETPALLVFAYSRCRGLCSVALHSLRQLVQSTQQVRPGRDYRVVLVALDPTQSLEDARRQLSLVTKGVRNDERTAFSSLRGQRAQIERLTSALGYRFRYDPQSDQYAHPAVMIAVNGEGRVAAYLHALGVVPDEFERMLRAARAAPVGTASPTQASLVGEVLRCFRFDPALRRHQAAIARYFRVGGAVILALLASLVFALLRWERRQSRG